MIIVKLSGGFFLVYQSIHLSYFYYCFYRCKNWPKAAFPGSFYDRQYAFCYAFFRLDKCRLFSSSSQNNCPDHSRDRKSTRLNSSHVSISYAVFCLNKKKKTSIQISSNATPLLYHLVNELSL